MGVEIRRIREDDAETLKRTRLALLSDSPSAFGSNLERELAFTDDVWAERAVGSSAGPTRSTFLAFDGNNAVGIVGGLRAGPVVELMSMWISPDLRRRGLGRRLVEETVEWATDAEAERVELWVMRGNDAAQRLYESLGFVVTAGHRSLPSDPCKDEIRMTRQLTVPPIS